MLGDYGRKLTASGLERGTERIAVAYNLSIDGVHTYHVGGREILVHNACFDLQALSDAGRVLDRNGFTAAGRAAQKHGNRAGDFGLPGSKTSSSYNQFGQDKLDDLLTAPNTATRSYVHKSYGQVTEYLSPSYGARFDSAGSFMGFL